MQWESWRRGRILVPQKEERYQEIDRGGFAECVCGGGGVAAVGGALRNAWKVSAKSGRLWTDNPLHHNASRSPLNELNES